MQRPLENHITEIHSLVYQPTIAPVVVGITTHGCQDTGNFSCPAAYAKAVQRYGGIPILLPPVQAVNQFQPAILLDRLDAIIFSGGGDIDPTHYDGDGHPTIYNVDRDRDAAEITLAEYALNSHIPLLGICRGLEILMVASGGKLIPHLPDAVGEKIPHRCDLSEPSRHIVEVLPNTQLAKIVGTRELDVISWHHQAVASVPTGWRLAAQAEDGVIEGLESDQHPWALALQWHPELAQDDRCQQRIFQSFVMAAQKYHTVSRAS